MNSKNRLLEMSLIPLAALLFLYHCVLASNAQASQTTKSSKAPILFFQHANASEIKPIKDSKACYQIQLSGLKEQVIYFANEPSRTTGVMTWSDFAVTWQHNALVEHIHPNAVIHAIEMKHNTSVNDTVILEEFHYNKSTNTASYKACALNPAAKFATGQLKDVSLFIDPFHPWP